MTPEDYRLEMARIAKKQQRNNLLLQAAWARHSLATHDMDGIAEAAAREEVLRINNDQMDLVGEVAQLKRKANYQC